MNHQRRNVKRSSKPLPIHGNFKKVRGQLNKVLRGNIKTLENWRTTVLVVCLAALAIDPLFLFIPVIDSHRFCSTFDKKLALTACVLRTFIDTFYVIHIIFHFITEIIVPRSQVSLIGELIAYSKAIKKRRLLFHFIVDIVSVLPIPQVVVLTFIPWKQHSASLVSKKILKLIILCQYIPRIIRIYPLFKEMTRASSTLAETKWIGAALNLSLYMLQSYVFGGFWYLSAIEKENRCWREACIKTSGCNLANLYCAQGGLDNRQFLNTTCPLIDPNQITNSTVFNFGIYIDALKSGVVESRDFPRKFVYCFWWGLRNLSALGQNFETSSSVEEILFAIIICVSGLLLFAVLIGNVQKYLQSTTIKVDEMEEKKRDTEKWMSYRMLPESLKERIRRSNDYKWRETRGTEEDALLRNLPRNLRVETKRHIYLEVLKHMPLFQDMDDRSLDSVCARLKTVFFTENSYILRQGEPIGDMFFIARGKLISATTSLGRLFAAVYLHAGDFCGEDLLPWTIESHTSHFPISSRTVQAVSEVEAFALSADDLQIFVTEYGKLHSKQLQDIYRFYSEKWRNWAACVVQAEWKRHCRRKLSKALCEEEGILNNTLQNDDTGANTLNLGALVYTSRFASISLRNLRENAAARNSRFHQMLSLPLKPTDPEFPMN